MNLKKLFTTPNAISVNFEKCNVILHTNKDVTKNQLKIKK